VDIMNNFFGTQLSQEDLQRRVAQRRSLSRSISTPQTQQQRQQQQSRHQSPMQSPVSTMSMGTMMGGGDTLDDIIMQNNNEMQRRQSYSQPYSPENDRRASMLEFGASDAGLNGFQFGDPTPTTEHPHSHLRRQSTGELDMDMGFGNMGSGMDMQMGQIGYSNGMQPNMMPMDTGNGYSSELPANMVSGMMGYVPMGMDGMSQGMSQGSTPMSMFAPNNFTPTYGSNGIDPMGSDFLMPSQDGLRGLSNDGNNENDDLMPSVPGLSLHDNVIGHSPASMTNIGPSIVDYNSPPPSALLPNNGAQSNSSLIPVNAPTPPILKDIDPKPEPPSSALAIYSSTGFDMLGALMRVATRKNPVVQIGAVDLSCAFVVCNLDEPDCPIIYVSDVFERLTGYSRHEVLGRNCRFLQSPDGKIQAGMMRNHTDNNAVYELKKSVEERTEAQQSIINYRKGGQPFLNLLTMIPIPANDTDPTLRLVVGFQVDVVLKPDSVDVDGNGGNYAINYKQGTLPPYVWQPPQSANRTVDAGQTISRDDVSAVLNSFENGSDPELTKRMWDKVLLENTDDVVHVLSLKGLFLYLSPSCRQVLEYDSSELVGTALSSVCHPSDIVPVTRELKDTSTGATVNVVFRIRRKNSGYTWFESHGSLCVEQGKGRKCIIMVGRERPVYALNRTDMTKSGGFGENELWTKISTSGMFLFVSSHVRPLLDRQPDELIGTSIQALMRADSKVEFGRALEKARTGKIVTYRHEILNKRGLVLQAQTSLYPGDASEGQKPTFLVAQTRFIKSSSRAVAPTSGANTPHFLAKSIIPANKPDMPTEVTPTSHPSGTSKSDPHHEPMSPGSSTYGPVTQAGGGGLPIGSQDVALASEDNIFDELKTTRCTSWQYELRQMEKSNRLLAEELATLLSAKKKRKRRKGAGHLQRDCANCHTKSTPEWRRGPSGNRDLCNSCGLRWAKQVSRDGSDATLANISTTRSSSSPKSQG
jgi:PAS domain S-box-containing protein